MLLWIAAGREYDPLVGGGKGKGRGVRRVTVVWQKHAWTVTGDEPSKVTLPRRAAISKKPPPPFYWELVDPAGKVVFTGADRDPRIGFHDHVAADGELEGQQFVHDFAVVDILVPDLPGAELRLHAAAPYLPGADAAPSPRVALTHVIGRANG